MASSIAYATLFAVVPVGAYLLPLLRSSPKEHLDLYDAKEKDDQLLALTREAGRLQEQFLDLGSRTTGELKAKDFQILALKDENESLRKQTLEVNGRVGQLEERMPTFLALTGENKWLNQELLDLRRRHEELQAKSYTALLSLANGNKALQDQLELTISTYTDEIAKLKISLRKAEAEREWVQSQMQTTQRTREDLEGSQSDEILELRDKLLEYSRHLQDRANGPGIAGSPSLFNPATLCYSCREPLSLGGSRSSSPV